MTRSVQQVLFVIGLILALSFRPLPKHDTQTSQQKMYIIRYTPEELQATYNAIVKLPYEQAAPLVASLQRQIQEQDAPTVGTSAPLTQPKKDSTNKQNKKQ